MKTLIQIILAGLFGSVAFADQVILHWSPDSPKPAEGIMVWVRDDGTLLSDSGLRKTEQLLQTCNDWRSQGTEPAFRIIIYPKLESNLDLGVIWPLISGLKEKNVAFELLIAGAKDDPEEDLITKKGSVQSGSNQPATLPESK